MGTLIAPAINLAILLGALAYFLWEPMKVYAEQRHHSLGAELRATREQLRAAKEKDEEFSAKLRAMDAEVAALRETARQDAATSKAKLVAEAQRLSAGIASDARVAAEGLYADLKAQLYSEIGTKVLERAEALLRERLTGDDRARICREFFDPNECNDGERLVSVAKSYAKALYETAWEGKKTPEDLDALEKQIETFIAIMDHSRDAQIALLGPVATAKEKSAVLESIAKKAGFQPLLLRFLELLVNKNRLGHLSEILEAFSSARLAAEGGVGGQLVAAEALSQADVEALSKAFNKKLGKKVTFRVSVDPSLLAGMKVTVNGVTYDGTLRSQLQNLKDQIRGKYANPA